MKPFAVGVLVGLLLASVVARAAAPPALPHWPDVLRIWRAGNVAPGTYFGTALGDKPGTVFQMQEAFYRCERLEGTPPTK
jgi:hypothetical protein